MRKHELWWVRKGGLAVCQLINVILEGIGSFPRGHTKWHWGLLSLHWTNLEGAWCRKQGLFWERHREGKRWYSCFGSLHQFMSYRMLTVRDNQTTEINSSTGVSEPPGFLELAGIPGRLCPVGVPSAQHIITSSAPSVNREEERWAGLDSEGFNDVWVLRCSQLGVLAEIHTQRCVFWNSWKVSTAQEWCVIRQVKRHTPVPCRTSSPLHECAPVSGTLITIREHWDTWVSSPGCWEWNECLFLAVGILGMKWVLIPGRWHIAALAEHQSVFRGEPAMCHSFPRQ